MFNYIRYYLNELFNNHEGWAIVILTIIPFLIILPRILFAKEFSTYAHDKGYTGSKYFWTWFFFPVIGTVMIYVMPNKKATERLLSMRMGNKPSEDISKCPYCGTPIRENAKYCSRCGNKIAE